MANVVKPKLFNVPSSYGFNKYTYGRERIDHLGLIDDEQKEFITKLNEIIKG